MTEIKILMERKKSLVKARKRALRENNLSYADVIEKEIELTQKQLKNARKTD